MEFLDLINRDTGPAGTGIQILGTYENEEKLRLEHPTGVVGDCYMVNNSLYVWDKNINDWHKSANIEGPIGPKGDRGPKGSLNPTSYNAVCFVSFKDSNSTGTSTITTTRIIPGIITLCDRISGVINDTGGKFYLYNTTTNEKISDMEFILNKGNTSDMNFSEVNFTDLYAGGNLEVKTEITGDNSSNVSFLINVILKSYKL